MLKYLREEKSIVYQSRSFKPYYRTKLGELYLGDCRKVLSTLRSNSVDLVVTSPPYGSIKKYHRWDSNIKDVSIKNLEYNEGFWDWDIFCNIVKVLYKIMKDGGVIVWITDDQVIEGSESCDSFKQALFFKEVGFKLHDTMIWNKMTFKYPSEYRYQNVFSYMFVFVKNKLKTHNLIKDTVRKNPGSKIYGVRRRVKMDDGSNQIVYRKRDKPRIVGRYGVRSNIWNIPVSMDIYDHPAKFPSQIAHDHIISWSNEGDLVLDPMCGSGTTLSMAEYLNRKWVGIDIIEYFINIAIERIMSERFSSFRFMKVLQKNGIKDFLDN